MSELITDLPFSDYLAHPAWSSSDLKLLLQKSAKQLKAKKDGRLPSKSSEALTMGSLYHAMVLEPDKVGERYELVPKFERRSKVAKEKWAQIVEDAEAAGKEAIMGDLAEMQELAAAVTSHPSWPHICGEEPMAEASIFWTDEETGLELKIRVDMLNLKWGERALATDLKTARSAQLDQFTRDALKLGYNISSAMYTDGVQQHFGVPCDWAWMAVEKVVPFEAQPIFPDASVQEHGRGLYRKALTELAECVKTDTWLGYGKGSAQKMELPAWMR